MKRHSDCYLFGEFWMTKMAQHFWISNKEIVDRYKQYNAIIYPEWNLVNNSGIWNRFVDRSQV